MTRLSTRSPVGHLVTLAAGVAIGLAAVGGAAAAPSAPVPVATVTHHLALAASAFAPDRIGNATLDYFNQWDPTTLSEEGTRCFNVGLQLPVNVRLVSVTFYYTAGSASMAMQVNRQNLITHRSMVLAVFSTFSQAAPMYTATTRKIPAHVAAVNYGKYAYSAGVCPRGNTTFSGLIITYTQRA